MNRWLFVLVALLGLLWWWQQQPSSRVQRAPSAPSESAQRVPDRPGGGLNPFVMDTDVGAPAGRPPMPAIPGQK